jgi:hypothetical protein
MTRSRSRIELALLLLVTVAAFAGCKRKETVKVEKTEDEAPQMASIVNTGNSQSDTQLVTGFYEIEEHAWRWTAQRFSVVLRPPAGSAERGATLTMMFSVPEPVISKLKTVSLSATIGATPLSPETYTQAGPYTYTRDIPAKALAADAVRVDFQLDKALPPANGDQRQLGVIVSSIGLEAK